MSDEGWAAYLKQAMGVRGLARASDLSKAAGVSESLISRWLRGESTPDIPNLRRIAPVLHKPVLELMVAAGHIDQAEARMKQPPSAPEPVRRGVSTDGLNADQERQLADYAEFLRGQNPKAKP